MANDKSVVIQTPDYQGPERRSEVEVVVKKCFCHREHERRLDDHERDIHEAKSENTDRDKAIASKVPNRLFYLFVGIVVAGLAFVYNGIHNVDKRIAVVCEKMDNNRIQYNRLENELREIQRKVQEHIYQTNNLLNGKENKK